MPAPRACRADEDRSKNLTSHPVSRSTSAAVRPPSEPPTTMTRGMAGTGCDPSRSGRARLWPAEGRDPHDLHLEQHPPLIDRGIAQPVGRVVLRVLDPDLVKLVGDALPLHRVVLGDLPLHLGLDAQPVIG